MLVTPVTTSQAAFGESSRTAARASPTSVSVSSLAPSLAPVLTASQFSMELQEIRAAETLLTLKQLSDRPTTYQSSLPVDTVPESPDDEVVFSSLSWQAATRPPHSTPTEQDLGTQGANTSVCTDYVSPVFRIWHAHLSYWSYLNNTVHSLKLLIYSLTKLYTCVT